MALPFDFQQDQELNVVILVDLLEGGKSKSVKVKPLTRNPVLGLKSYFGSDKKGYEDPKLRLCRGSIIACGDQR
jgi:hypothetical protein